MKLLLDVDDTMDYDNALQAARLVMMQAPNQEVGSKGAIPMRLDGQAYLVTRNQDSYTSELRR